MSKSMEKRLRAQRPIVLAAVERDADRGWGEHDDATVLALCAALRECVHEVDTCSAGGDVGRNILARHNIVLDAEGE